MHFQHILRLQLIHSRRIAPIRASRGAAHKPNRARRGVPETFRTPHRTRDAKNL
jgi:hypothetical protein